MEDKATIVNCGLGDKIGKINLYRNLTNPGGSSVIQYDNTMPTETVRIISLDAYLSENQIATSKVKYIWIDTEGFEAKVLLGAKNLLKENPAPIFMECNLKAWDESGHFEDMMTLLSENYSHFVHIQSGKIYPLEALRTMERPNNGFGQIGDIFLIKRGAID